MVEQEQTFDKARQYAYWSYTGLLIPVIGIILSALSLSTLKALKPTRDEEAEYYRVKQVAEVGMRLSVVLLVLSIAGAIIWAVNYVQAQNKLNQAQQQYINAVNNLR